jgi:casein kinase 1
MLKNKKQADLLVGLPPVFGQLFAYLKELKFDSTPDYGKIQGMLNALMKKNGYEWDYKYDW